ncbi:MAG: ABC transporter ATP-binding protein [Roseobacter sp.]|jgi:ABC-type transport system involved in cytochrome bd biosynthesis fused ATPase/permease subunit|nr:ABC transporter ATP-binding protein [Roseobacter sp.]
MSARPEILSDGRQHALALLVALSFAQAGAMVAAAFAARDVFRFLRDGGPVLPVGALVVIAVSGLVLFACRTLEGRIGERAGQSYAAAIRKTLFLHVSRMPLRDVARRRSGALALRYVGDLTAFKGWIARGLARLISASVTIPAALLVLYLLDPWLLAAASGPLAAVVLGILLMGTALGAAHARLRSTRARLAAAMAERLPQGIQLRRAGRVRTELRALKARSGDVADAGVHRETLAATVRALPDAGAGLAGALCLLVCMRLGLGIPEAVAAMTALSMVVWPLRQLADVADRRRAFLVASSKLDRLLASPRVPGGKGLPARDSKPAVAIDRAQIFGGAPLTLTLARGEQRRLAGPSGSGKSALLLALAGFDVAPSSKVFHVLGRAPSSLGPGEVLYLGPRSPGLAGTLRREVTIGLDRVPQDAEIAQALVTAGLADTLTRIGGLDGKIAEQRRNLSASEQVGLLLARGLLASPKLALVDADEVGLDRNALNALLDHFAAIETAVLVVTRDPAATLRLGRPIEIGLSETAEAGRPTRVGATGQDQLEA